MLFTWTELLLYIYGMPFSSIAEFSAECSVYQAVDPAQSGAD